MKTNIYVDGFNLYYGSLKDTSSKWLDLHALCERVLPRGTVVHRIRYFTARVQPRPDDPTQAVRQQTYFRALETLPALSIHLGFFKTFSQMRKLTQPLPDGIKYVSVLDTKEKGSDVNLATMLLLDGFRKDYERAAVISNDSDLALPVEVTKNELGLPVIVVSPDRRGRVSKELQAAASSCRTIRKSALKQCQFPATLQDAAGRTITKPASW